MFSSRLPFCASSQLDVFSDGSFKQSCGLSNNIDALIQPTGRNTSSFKSVHSYLSVVAVINLKEKVGDSRFAGTALTNHKRSLALFELQLDVFENRNTRTSRVGKSDTVENDVSIALLRILSNIYLAGLGAVDELVDESCRYHGFHDRHHLSGDGSNMGRDSHCRKETGHDRSSSQVSDLNLLGPKPETLDEHDQCKYLHERLLSSRPCCELHVAYGSKMHLILKNRHLFLLAVGELDML